MLPLHRLGWIRGRNLPVHVVLNALLGVRPLNHDRGFRRVVWGVTVLLEATIKRHVLVAWWGLVHVLFRFFPSEDRSARSDNQCQDQKRKLSSAKSAQESFGVAHDECSIGVLELVRKFLRAVARHVVF